MSQAAATHFVEASTFLGARGGRARIDEVGLAFHAVEGHGPRPTFGTLKEEARSHVALEKNRISRL